MRDSVALSYEELHLKRVPLRVYQGTTDLKRVVRAVVSRIRSRTGWTKVDDAARLDAARAAFMTRSQGA